MKRNIIITGYFCFLSVVYEHRGYRAPTLEVDTVLSGSRCTKPNVALISSFRRCLLSLSDG